MPRRIEARTMAEIVRIREAQTEKARLDCANAQLALDAATDRERAALEALAQTERGWRDVATQPRVEVELLSAWASARSGALALAESRATQVRQRQAASTERLWSLSMALGRLQVAQRIAHDGARKRLRNRDEAQLAETENRLVAAWRRS